MNLFTEMNLNKITLSFASEMEKDYQAHYFKDSIKVLRVAMIFVTILYAVFGVLDVIIVPKYMNLFLTIRFAIVIPILLLALGLTYFRIFEEIWQWVLFFAYIIGGIGIAVMLTKVPENLSYYGGMILVFSSGYFFVKLRFVMATVGGWLLLLIVNILMLTLSDATPSILIAYNFFYISANIINMLAAYYTELYYRRSYLLNIQLLNKKNELEETNINLESEVKIRTHELSQSERKYRELFNLNKYGISIFYINPLNGDVSKFVEFNEAAPKMLGYSIEEMYNLSPDQIELNVDFEQMKERKSELIAHGFVDFETILKHKSGRTVYAEFRSQLVQYNDKPAIMNIVRDISKRKQIEKALNEKDALYRTVVSNAPLVTFVTDNKGIFTLSEGSVLEKLGLRPGQVVGLSVFDVYRDSPKIIEAMNIALEGNSNRTEIEVQGLVFDVIFSPILDAAGKVIQVIGVSNEITERKQTETELQKSEEKFSRTFSVNPSAISIIDLNDNFRYIDINETFESLTGFSRNEIIGRSSSEIGLFESEQIDEYYNLLKLDKSIKGLEINFKNKNGEIKTGLISFEKIELDNHSYLISTTHDITERKKAEELLYQKNYEIESQYEEYMQLNEVLRNTNYDLENAKEKAEESDRLKTAFLQNMSHEIRTPLNGIIGFSNLLISDNISKTEIKEFTGIILKSGKRLIEIVNNVLDLSKIETGQIEIYKRSFPVNSIIKDLHSLFTHHAEVVGLKLNYHIANDDNFQIHSDDSKIQQILSNLLNNAIKFTKSGSIDFGYETIDDCLRFFVKDTGVGISPENCVKIFDRFAQVDLSISRGYEGAGLGLAICRGLSELLGGKIWVVSEVNKGSIFYFSLPVM